MASEDERWGESEPVEDHGPQGGGWSVHWSGYVRDPKPTEARRAEGKFVVVYGDGELELAPTAFPWLPPEWSDRFVRLERRPMVGGGPGRRFITDARFAAAATEAVYSQAKAGGYFDVGEMGGSHPLDIQASSPSVSIVDLPTEALPSGCLAACVGGVWVDSALIALLRDLGVEEVRVRNEGPTDKAIVADGVAVVMGIRLPEDS